ncbi:MAG: hypothetical protein AAF487_13830 [Bacteroidota bacterium]
MSREIKNIIMSLNLPNHPLFNQLCKKSSDILPSLDFVHHQISRGRVSFKSKDDLIVTIQHGGYDMPEVLFGYRQDPSIIRSWVLLEYYIDQQTPIYKKHVELKSFYDFEFDFELLKTHHDRILGIVKKPKAYLDWQKKTNIPDIFKV